MVGIALPNGKHVCEKITSGNLLLQTQTAYQKWSIRRYNEFTIQKLSLNTT